MTYSIYVLVYLGCYTTSIEHEKKKSEDDEAKGREDGDLEVS